MAEVALAFFWHQHQPYYPDDLSGDNPMPWVRLHGVKDYYGMALHLEEVPEMRCTINLVPSLLVQLQAYTERGASDRPLDVSRIGAKDLGESDCLYLLDHFFMANPQHMIGPYPRYLELFQRRAPGRNTAQEALRRFKEQDYRDLQVWFNLAWIHPLAVARDAELRNLVKKGRLFSEDDKNLVLDKHLEILKAVIPLHKKLADSGQVELTTTPFFHPIVPLLLDKKLAKEAMPEVKLPRHSGGYPEDAAVHVRRAIEQHASLFGSPPWGMWPAEGSVCQAMIPLLAQHGIRWIATDEEILGQSTQGFVSRDDKGHVRNPELLYQPYLVKDGAHELNIVFRDHALSDMIGFHYQRSPGAEAADDFVRHLANIRKAVNHKLPVLVSVILDGENCWEHYAEGGVTFLRALYERCTKTPEIRPVPLGEYLEPAAGFITTSPSGLAMTRTTPPGTPCTGRGNTFAAAPSRSTSLRNAFSGPGRKFTLPRVVTGSGGMATIIPAPRIRCLIICFASTCKMSICWWGTRRRRSWAGPSAAAARRPFTPCRAVSWK